MSRRRGGAGPRVPRVLAVLSALTVLAAAASTNASYAADPVAGTAHLTLTPRQDTLLDGPAHGRRAVRELGDALDVAARRNGVTPTKLRTLLTTDRTAWLDGGGRLYFVDPAAPDRPGLDPPAETAAYPLDQTFSLHSAPGSKRVIFLDFDGTNVSGTAWNQPTGMNLTPGDYPGWDTDGDPTTFNDAERGAIQSIWQRVSEDYAPFDVDVTTQDPGPDALVNNGASGDAYGVRALISPSTSAATQLCNNACGGIAYVGTYDNVSSTPYTQPAWVFPQKLGPNGTKAIAEAVSHEVGHNLGLSHDGTATVGYYQGQGSWAPIMGVGYYKPITQWSKGEYTGANNHEDDLSVIDAHGLDYRTDEAGGTIASATPITTSTSGFITQRGDVDVYKLYRTCTDPFTATATPAPTSPNLDLQLDLLGPDGATIVTSNPPSGGSGDVATGLSASATMQTSQGVYAYLEVDGVGALDPASTGYSDYGSLGQYSLVVTDPCPATAPLVPQGLHISRDDTSGSATLSWSPPEYDGGSAITGYRVTVDGGAGVDLAASSRSHTTTGLVPGQSVTMTVAAVNAVGAGPAGSASVTMTAGLPTAPTALSTVTNDDAGTADVSWAPPLDDGGTAVSGYQVQIDEDAVIPVPAPTTSYTFSGLSRGVVHTVRVRAVNLTGAGVAATASFTVAALPGAPSNVGVSRMDAPAQAATLSWLPPADDGGAAVTAYRLLRDGVEIAVLGGSARQYTFDGLPRGVSTQLAVAAVNRLGAGPSRGVAVQLAPAPTAPTAVTAQQGNARVTVAWLPPSNAATAQVTGYEIRRYAGGGASTPVTLPATARSYVWTGLANGTSYRFGVVALSGLSSSTQAMSGAVVPATRPGAPRIGQAKPGTGGGVVTATATWRSPTSTGGSVVTGYVVTAYRVSAAGRIVQTLVSSLRPARSTSYAMNVRHAGSWRFRVRAVNAVGTSPASARSNLVSAR